MIKIDENIDLLIIGGGAAGMAAATVAHKKNIKKILILEKESRPGGILQQCIHAGFGLHYFKEELTGPEYAEKFINEIKKYQIDIITQAFVFDIIYNDDRTKSVQFAAPEYGIRKINAKAVILASGSFERTRPAIKIPGNNPAGVMTAGLAQKLINIKGLRPGNKAVILGSGDIGLIMARRLALENIEVEGVYEILPHSSGLKRNIVQCLDDFNIPLHLSTTVTKIHGLHRVEAVDVTPVDENFRPIHEKSRTVPCDTLLLSVGLIPERKLPRKLKLAINPKTGGPIVDSNCQTSIPGVFAAGNALHIHDLVDFVTYEAQTAANAAVNYINDLPLNKDTVELLPGKNVSYCVPNTFSTKSPLTVRLRASKNLENSTLTLGPDYKKNLPFAVPSEMITLEIPPEKLQNIQSNQLTIDINPK